MRGKKKDRAGRSAVWFRIRKSDGELPVLAACRRQRHHDLAEELLRAVLAKRLHKQYPRFVGNAFGNLSYL